MEPRFYVSSISAEVVTVRIVIEVEAVSGVAANGETNTFTGDYAIHKSTLIKNSDYFRKALSGDWKEGQEGLITLKDVSEDAFKVYVHWLYTKSVPPHDSNGWHDIFGLPDDIEQIELIEMKMLACLEAYMFGDRIMDPAFVHAVDNTFCDLVENNHMSGSYRWDVLEYAFKNIPTDRLILQLLVDDFCQYWKEGEDTLEDIAAQERLPISFHKRVARAFSAFGSYSSRQYNDQCYKEHKAQEKSACPYYHLEYCKEKQFWHREGLHKTVVKRFNEMVVNCPDTDCGDYY